MMNDTALILISTGETYCNTFLKPLLEDIKKFWPWADVLLFTDSARSFGVKRQVHVEHQGWPGSSLHRYSYFLSQRLWLEQYTHVFYLDVDMRIIRPIEKDILSDGVITVTHPNFETGPGCPDNNQKSTAYLPSDKIRQYFCGAFQGGAVQPYLAMAATIDRNIETDRQNGVTALWFDESHLNRYCYDHPPFKILSTDYCSQTQDSTTARIMSVIKDSNQFHTEVSIKMPKVSYIVSAHERPNMLRCCLASLAVQSDPDFEVIVADNAENHETHMKHWHIVESLADVRFSCIDTNSVKSGELWDSYHSSEFIARRYAKGDWLCFPSDDSYYVPIFQEALMTAAQVGGWQFVYCDIVSDRRNGNRFGYYTEIKIRAAAGSIDKTGFLVKRDAFLKCGFPQKEFNGFRACDGFLVEEIVNSGAPFGKVDELLLVHN